MLTPSDIKEMVRRISSVVLKTTLPLYTFSNNRYAIHSNGILFLGDNKVYLVTAEHTFDQMDPGELLIYQHGSFCCLEGNIIGNKTHDIALFEIEKSIADCLAENYMFIDRNHIAFNHIVEAKQKYLLIGYPSSKTKVLSMKIFEKPLVYHTSALKKQPTANEITFSYNKRKSITYDKKVYIFAPDPYGLSGCGLWYLSSFSQDINYKLVGIFKEYDRKKNVGVATHVRSLLEQV